jgi:hypothetical protein
MEELVLKRVVDLAVSVMALQLVMMGKLAMLLSYTFHPFHLLLRKNHSKFLYTRL